MVYIKHFLKNVIFIKIQIDLKVFLLFKKLVKVILVNTKSLILYCGLKSGLKYNKTNINTI
jgi:hypothetical protein